MLILSWGGELFQVFMTAEFPRTDIRSSLASVAFRTYTSNFDIKVKKTQNCYYAIETKMPVTLTGIITEVWNRHHSQEKQKKRVV
jgi:hypothetical protein